MARRGAFVIMDDAALPTEAQERLKALGRFDVVIGIPSHRNARTIGEVVDAAVEGIGSYLADQRVLLMNADGGSSDNTTRFVEDARTPANATAFVTEYAGTMGKGNAIRAIMEAAGLVEARACAILEARCPGIAPEWVAALVNPVLGGVDMAIATYDRSAYASALTDNIAYPFARMLFHTDLREPLSSELCLSGELAQELAMRDVWETDVSRFGANVWMTLEALVGNRRLVQVEVGYRGEGHVEPGALADLRFLHTVGTLFRYLTTHRTLWQQDLPARAIPRQGSRVSERVIPSPDSVDLMLEGFAEGQKVYGSQWEQVLLPKTLQAVRALAKQPTSAFEFPLDLWADVLLEFALVYNRGDGDPDKVVESLLPIYYARAAAYVLRNADHPRVEREREVQALALTLMQRRPVLRRLWEDYHPWLDPTGFFPNG